MKGRLCVVRRFIAMILCFALLLGLAACTQKTQEQQYETEETGDDTTAQSTEEVYHNDLPVFKEQNTQIFVSYDQEASWQLLSAGNDVLVGPGQNDSGDTLAFQVKNDALFVSFDGETSWQLLGSVKDVPGADGEKTVTPQFKTDETVLYVSFDDSASWTELAKLQCKHNYESGEPDGMNILHDAKVQHTCTICGHSYTETIPATKKLKVLAIGNSFSVDALAHLYGLFEDAGVEDYTIGNLYIGGCSIDRHWTYMKQNDAYYTFTCVSNGQTTRMDDIIASDGLTFDDWDIITLQQLSHESADEAYFENLQNVIDYVKKKAPQAQIWWHMGWSYPEGAQDLKNLNMTQLELYEGIVEVIDSTILTNPNITGVIPVGTTIQNLRTSKLGDTLNRDDTHLTEGIGRYAAAMTWLAALTGADIDKISWTPEKFKEVNYALPFIKDAVKKAIQSPYAVTQSAYPAESNG